MIKVNLINSQFSRQEAREILLNLIQSKITFHNQKNFSSQERFGHPDIVSVKRIDELQIAGRELMKGLEGIDSNSQLKVFSEISITTVLKSSVRKTKSESGKKIKSKTQ